jgi:hypothetical protein
MLLGYFEILDIFFLGDIFLAGKIHIQNPKAFIGLCREMVEINPEEICTGLIDDVFLMIYYLLKVVFCYL